MLLGHRYYDAAIGRFLVRDPYESGSNWYAYCDNNPLRGVDPAGLFTVLGYEFTWTVVWDGLKTGVGGLSAGFGGPDLGQSGQPGFKGSVACATVASICLAVADGGETGGLIGDGGLGDGGLEGGAGSCFPAGTKVLMADGSYKNIEDIQLGDHVESRDQKATSNGSLESEAVSGKYVHTAPATETISFESGASVVSTPSHRYYVQGRGFTPASQIKPGDKIDEASGHWAKVRKISTHSSPTLVYNIKVSSAHTYFVRAGQQSLWVHNECGSPGPWDGKTPAEIENQWDRGVGRKGGVKLRCPDDPEYTSVRIERNHPDYGPADGYHVHILDHGKVIDRNGNIASGDRHDPLVHIPYEEWKTWPRWNSPK